MIEETAELGLCLKKVAELGMPMVYTDSIEESDKIRRKILRYLSVLRKKFVDNEEILATTADFYKPNAKAYKLLEKAYKIAKRKENHERCVYIADSMLRRLVMEKKKDLESLKKWLVELEQGLKLSSDKDYEDAYEEYKKQIL